MHEASRAPIVGLLASAVLLLGACSSGSDAGSGEPTTSAPADTSTTAAPATGITASVASEREVDRAYRQGLGKAAEGWVFSTNFSLFRTDEALVRTVTVDAAIPPEWVEKGYDHIGDVDVVGDVVHVPLEQPDYGADRQAMLRYDLETLGYLDGVEVSQSHNAWVAVDADTMTAYSMSGFSDDTVLRYDIDAGWEPLEPIQLSTTIDRVQGGDLRDGALWLSTDDETDGVYRVDLATGDVVALGSIGHVESEGEGIDATTLDAGDLHVLTAAPLPGPVLLVALEIARPSD
jgi:hypothetical protein